MIDADDLVVMPQLSDLARRLSCRIVHRSVRRVQIFKRTVPWRYAGVLHEYPTCDDAQASTGRGGRLLHPFRRLGYRNRDRGSREGCRRPSGGARRRAGQRSLRLPYAQNYFDASDRARPGCYRRRIAVGGWERRSSTRVCAPPSVWAPRPAVAERAPPTWTASNDTRRAPAAAALIALPERSGRLLRRLRVAARAHGSWPDAMPCFCNATSATTGPSTSRRSPPTTSADDESFRINAHLLRTAPLPDAGRSRIETTATSRSPLSAGTFSSATPISSSAWRRAVPAAAR
jgi:hypothetical protein